MESLRLEHAYLQGTCAPWDGPATALFLADGAAVGDVVPRPFLLISVYEGVLSVSGNRFRITPQNGDIGAALACTADGECEPLAEAVVKFGTLDEGAPARVTVRVTRAGGRVEGGQFDAGWLEPANLCG